MPPIGPRRPWLLASAVGLFASGGAFVALTRLIDGPAVWEVLKDVNQPIMAAAIGSLTLSMIVRTARWRSIIPSADAWFLIGLPLGVWLFLRGRVEWSGLAISPYIWAFYFFWLLPVVNRPPAEEACGTGVGGQVGHCAERR